MTAPSEIFTPVRQRRAFEEIVLQVEQAILEGRLHEGDRLPPERDLATIFGVSRPAVREAMRVLDAFGVIVARRGSGPESGSVVSSPGEQNGLGGLLRLYAALMQIPQIDLIEVRVALEAAAARAAARRASDEDLARLDAIVQRMGDASDPEAFLELDTEFHVALAEVSGNSAAFLIMAALREAIGHRMLLAFQAVEDFEHERQNLITEHGEIVEVLRRGDPDAGAEVLSDHVTSFYERVMRDFDAGSKPNAADYRPSGEPSGGGR